MKNRLQNCMHSFRSLDFCRRHKQHTLAAKLSAKNTRKACSRCDASGVQTKVKVGSANLSSFFKSHLSLQSPMIKLPRFSNTSTGCCQPNHNHHPRSHRSSRDPSIVAYLTTAVSVTIILLVAYQYIMIRTSFRSLKSLASKARSRMYSTVERGTAQASDYRLYFKNSEGKVISPFHDIPLLAAHHEQGTTRTTTSPLYNMIVEIPRWTNAKMEIATKEPFNPIKQDVKKGKLRYVHNCFPYHGYIWNYGALPQTWENPSFVDPHTKTKGDNDPIDVCEIGSQTLKCGQVVLVKVLGVMALIDDGETDWKLIVIKADDPLAGSLNDIGDVEHHMPGLLKATHEWFKIYKIPDGKPANEFAFDGQAKGAEFARKIIKETHEQWKELIHNSKVGEQSLELQNISIEKSPFKVASNASVACLNNQSDFKAAKPHTQEEMDQLLKVCYVKNQ